MANTNSPKPKNQVWHIFILSVLYLGSFPQLLGKIFIPGDMPSLVEANPETVIIFWRAILFVLFAIIIPAILAYFGSQEKCWKIYCWSVWSIKLGRLFYYFLWFIGLIIFITYLATEISGLDPKILFNHIK